jgi:hypothetical protein
VCRDSVASRKRQKKQNLPRSNTKPRAAPINREIGRLESLTLDVERTNAPAMIATRIKTAAEVLFDNIYLTFAPDCAGWVADWNAY